MSLILTADEELLRDSVRRFVADRTPLTAVRELIAVGEPYDTGVWKQLTAQLGVAGLAIPEEYGGAGAGHAAMAVALQELGAGLVPSPLLASGVLAAGTLLALDDMAAREALLPGIASGETVAALALTGPAGAGRAGVRATGTGGGLARLSGELAEILPGADVVICDPAGYPLAATTRSAAQAPDVRALYTREGSGRVTSGWLVAGVHKDTETGTPWAAAVIRAGEMRHGWVLAVGGAQGLPGAAGVAVEQAALVAALEITRDLAVLAVEQQFASNALHDLVTGTAANMDQALERAVRFGWDLRRPLTVLVARDSGIDSDIKRGGTEPGDDAVRPQDGHPQEAAALRAVELWTRAVRDRDRDAAVAGFATELVGVVGVADAAALARKVHADMTASTGRAYSVGVSQVGAGPLDIPRRYEEARVALQVGRRLNGSGAVTNFAGLGLYRLISNVSQAELRAFVHDTLGPVLDLPEPARSDLLKSLAVLSSTRFNVAESARILHYHYNTMRYRVTKLERMLGEFADDAAATLRIGVALEVLRMYEISGDTLQALL